MSAAEALNLLERAVGGDAGCGVAPGLALLVGFVLVGGGVVAAIVKPRQPGDDGYGVAGCAMVLVALAGPPLIACVVLLVAFVGSGFFCMGDW